MSLWISEHAYQRAKERMGWRGTAATLSALLRSYRGVQAALQIGGGPGVVYLPQERISVVLKGETVVTIINGKRPVTFWGDK